MVKIDYEKYHKSDSRTKLSGFEIARWDALTHFIPRNVPAIDNPYILDYGAGTGLHIELWQKLFPSSELYLCDISTIGKEKCLQIVLLVLSKTQSLLTCFKYLIISS